MKKLIPITLAGAVAMLMCGVAFADDMGMGMKKDNMTMEQRMVKKQADRLEMMTKSLSLTTEQKDKVDAILKANGEQKKAAMMKMEADEKAMKENEDMQIKAVLSPDQQMKYDKMMAEHKAKMEKKMGEMKEKMEKK